MNIVKSAKFYNNYHTAHTAIPLIQRWIFWARVRDQPTKYTYAIPTIIRDKLMKGGIGGKRLETILSSRKSYFQLLEEWYAAKADCKFLLKEMKSPSRALLAARWKMFHYGMPIDYVLGWTPFGRDLRIQVKRPILIPRTETAGWLEEFIDILPRDTPLRILEIGTGTGCISIYLKTRLSNLDIMAVDISKTALKLAAINAKRHNVQIHLTEMDLFKMNRYYLDENHIGMIICNPPYVPPASRASQVAPSVRKWEASSAVIGIGYHHGASFHQRILELAINIPRKETLIPRVALELDGTEAQLKWVLQMADKLNDFSKRTVIYDSAGHPRAIILF